MTARTADPALINAGGYSWSTFPETLGKAGISWKIYQDQGHGLNAAGNFGQDPNPYVGNYGCNTLLRFAQYQNAAPGSPLFEHARTGTNISESGSLFDVFRQDVQANRLPQVSWIVPPEAYTEHPNWPANYGAWYVSQILDALTANPDTWSKTAFFLTYDENDGFFDHMVPPTPPQTKGQGLSTVDLTDEIFAGNSEFPAGPYGLGMRVPMIVISPWSTGGWINSQVFDHTSLIRFIQARFGLSETQLDEKNITAWRSAVSGDLTSAFDFSRGAPAVLPLPVRSMDLHRPAKGRVNSQLAPYHHWCWELRPFCLWSEWLLPCLPGNISQPVQRQSSKRHSLRYFAIRDHPAN